MAFIHVCQYPSCALPKFLSESKTNKLHGNTINVHIEDNFKLALPRPSHGDIQGGQDYSTQHTDENICFDVYYQQSTLMDAIIKIHRSPSKYVFPQSIYFCNSKGRKLIKQYLQCPVIYYMVSILMIA